MVIVQSEFCSGCMVGNNREAESKVGNLGHEIIEGRPIDKHHTRI